MNDWLSLMLRTLVVYFFIMVMMRLMGRKELAQLNVFDLVVVIMIAEVSSIAIENNDKPIWHALWPIVILIVTQVALSYLSVKSKRFRHFIDGKPTVIIKNGRIQDKAMVKERYNLNELMVQLRQKNINDVADVELAILEPSGILDVFPKTEKMPVTREDLQLHIPYEGLSIPLIMDGQIINKNMERLGLNRFWLKNQIQAYGLQEVKDVFFASIDHQGKLYVDKKDQHPPSDIE